MAGPLALCVVVVCHDNAADIAATLHALDDQLAPGDELIVIDNASQDGTADVVRTVSKGARVIEPGRNLGFAGGCRVGAAYGSQPLLLFLNPDARPATGCLEALRGCAVTQSAWGAWQALVTLPGGTEVNTAGNPVHFLGFGWAGDHGTLVEGVARHPTEVASASGAALVVRRKAWEDVGGFDERYFMYGEDLDLSLRLRLAGWGVGLTPGARVEHAYAFAKGDYKWFYLERNRWWTLLGVYPTALLVRLAPALLAFELALLPVALRGGWLGAKLRAQAAVLRALPAMLERRHSVQRSARVTPAAFASGLTARTDSQFFGSPGRWRLVGRVLQAYWRWVCRGL